MTSLLCQDRTGCPGTAWRSAIFPSGPFRELLIEVITCIAASTLPIRNALREGIKPAFERGLVVKVLRSLSVIAVHPSCVSAISKSLG